MNKTKDNMVSSPRGGQEGASTLISGAEAMMRSLENQGVDVLFGYPGGAIMPTYDALYDHRDKLHQSWSVTNRPPYMPHRAMPV